MTTQTEVGIRGRDFLIDGRPTLEGRVWNGLSLQGLLPNARLVQGIFDDRNPETVARWAYRDTGRWDPARNTAEFLAAMPDWRAHGLLAFTLNLQGGSPEGYSGIQPWINTAIRPDGSLDEGYMARAGRILDCADKLGMVVILGLFYFGQAHRVADEVAVLRAVDAACRWVLQEGRRNVLIEINNECDHQHYSHAILQPPRVAELIVRARAIGHCGRRLLVGTSFCGGVVPTPEVAEVSDFLLLHGNGVGQPGRIREMVHEARALAPDEPILFNEDDHFDFDQPDNHFLAALGEGASWGFFDYRQSGDPTEGFQSVPVDWTLRHPRKRAFFELLKNVTGS